MDAMISSELDNQGYTMLSDLQNNSMLSVVNEATGMKSNNPAVLCTLFGKVLDYSRPTRNNRLYTEMLCDAIANSSRVNELNTTGNFLGEGDHPMEYQKRADIHYPLVTHGIRGLVKVPEEQCYKAYIDILDTPNGRIIKTLIDYGTTIGISSRGFGRSSKPNEQGVIEVSPDNYIFITFDLVPYPGNIAARLNPVDNSTTGLNESTEYSQDEVNKLINENFTEITKSYLESNDVESLKSIKPVLTYLNESGDYQSLIEEVDAQLSTSISTSNDKLAERLLQAYATISERESELESKELIINQLNDEINELQSTSSGLSEQVITLTNQLDERDELIGDLRRQLSSFVNKVNQLEDEVTKVNENYELLGNELADSRKELSDTVSKNDKRISILESNNLELTEKLNESTEMIDQYRSESVTSDKKYSSLMESYLSAKCSTVGVTPDSVLSLMNESFDTLGNLDKFKVDNAVSLVRKSNSRNRRRQVAQPLNEAFDVSKKIHLSEDNPFTEATIGKVNESTDPALESIRQTIKLAQDKVVEVK